MKRNFKLSAVRESPGRLATGLAETTPLAVGEVIVYPPEGPTARSRIWTVVAIDEAADLITLQD